MFHTTSAMAGLCARKAAVPLARDRKRQQLNGLAMRRQFGGSQCRTVPARGAKARKAVQARAEEDVTDRIFASVPYFLPFMDGIRFGRFFFLSFPGAANALLMPLEPILRVYFSTPFLSVVLFFVIYLGIIQNRQFNRFVRFNAMQAVIVDIMLIFPSLCEQLFRGIGQNPLYVTVYNVVWIYVLLSFIYAVASCLAGKAVKLPIVGDAAEAQVPF